VLLVENSSEEVSEETVATSILAEEEKGARDDDDDESAVESIPLVGFDAFVGAVVLKTVAILTERFRLLLLEVSLDATNDSSAVASATVVASLIFTSNLLPFVSFGILLATIAASSAAATHAPTAIYFDLQYIHEHNQGAAPPPIRAKIVVKPSPLLRTSAGYNSLVYIHNA